MHNSWIVYYTSVILHNLRLNKCEEKLQIKTKNVLDEIFLKTFENIYSIINFIEGDIIEVRVKFSHS